MLKYSWGWLFSRGAAVCISCCSVHAPSPGLLLVVMVLGVRGRPHVWRLLALSAVGAPQEWQLSAGRVQGQEGLEMFMALGDPILMWEQRGNIVEQSLSKGYVTVLWHAPRPMGQPPACRTWAGRADPLFIFLAELPFFF